MSLVRFEGDNESHQLPAGWQTVALEDVAMVFLGKTPGRTEYCSEGLYKIIKFRDLTGRGIDFSNSKDSFVIEKFALLASLKEIEVNDVLITSAAHSGENIGKKCALVQHIPDEYRTTFFTGELLNIRASVGDSFPKWIFYFFQSEEGYREIQRAVKGVHLTAGRAKKMRIPVAPIREQKLIVERLDKLLHKIQDVKARLDTIPAILKRFRQAVLATACSGRLTADWRERNSSIEPAYESLGHIRRIRLESAKTEKERIAIESFYQADSLNQAQEIIDEDLPTTWIACQIGAIGNICNGSTPSRKRMDYWNGGIPWVSSGEVQNCLISKTRESISDAGYNNSSVRMLPPGSVLLAMIGEGKTRGQSAILKIPSTINQNIAAIVLDHGLMSSEYLWYWFQYQYEVTRQSGSGSGPRALNCQRVRELSIALPPQEEQQEIVRRVEALFKTADQIKARYHKARAFVDKLTPAILAKALRGELVPQDPNDEPASTLLERIRHTRDSQALRSSEERMPRKIRKSKNQEVTTL